MSRTKQKRVTAKPKECTAPECKNTDIHARGLCVSCYQSAIRKCNAGEWTWKFLEGKGWALPRRRGGRLTALYQAVVSSQK